MSDDQDSTTGARAASRSPLRLARSAVARATLLAVAASALFGGAVAHASTVTATATSSTAAATTMTASTTSTTTTTTSTSSAMQVGVAVPLTNYNKQVAYWAATAAPGTAIHSGPASHDRTVAHLHLLTEDGLPEVYQIISEEVDKWGTLWVHIAVPMRPNGVTGWVPADDLTSPNVVRALLLINLTAHTLTLYHNGKVVFHSAVGNGKPSTPTPTGRFWVREKFPVSVVAPVYGPFAIGTSDYSNTETDWPGGGIVGIHGTDQPNLIPGAPSHGCVRLKNAEITKLYPLVQIGTPIVIIAPQ